MKALSLAKKFVRDYYNYQRITSDMLNYRRDGLINIVCATAHRIYVDEEKNIVYWGFQSTGPTYKYLLNTINCRRAKKLGYQFENTTLFGVNYLKIVGVK